MADPIRVLVADDHPLILEAIVAILDSVPDFEVVGTTDEAGRAVDFVAEHKPRVVVMDILMPGVDSFQAVDEIRRLSPGTDVVFVSGADHDVMLEQARRCGSIGFVSKGDGPACVEEAIRAAVQGETYYSP